MTREEAIKIFNTVLFFGKCDAQKEELEECLKMAIEVLDQKPCEDCISRVDALRVAKNEYLRGWHNALCKALSEKYSIHCEEGNFSVIQEETITGLGLSMDCAVGKDVESYMSALPSVTPTQKWIPVSERLPKEEKQTYWICTNNGYQCECRWTNVNPFWTDLTTSWHWHYMDVPQYSKVIAWMPLPESYKEE